MNRQEFIKKLRNDLSFLPNEEKEDRISFYNEMIDDKIEEGLKEEDAIRSIGSIEEITNQIINDMPLSKIAKNKIKPKRNLSALEIILIILGFPIWFTLLVSFFSIIISLYISGWAIIISLWAIFISLIAGSFASFVMTIVYFVASESMVGITVFGITLLLIGLSIFMLFICEYLTNLYIKLSKSLVLGLKKKLLKRGEK